MPPAADGRHKALYNRFVLWRRVGVFDRIFATLATERAATNTVMMEPSPPPNAPHRGELAQNEAVLLRIGRTKGGQTSKLHAGCDVDGKPLILLLTEGQISDYRGAGTVLRGLPDAKTMLVDQGRRGATGSARP
ncbi:MAG: transposase [Planctomycetota bacterium]|jgi:transposase